MAGDALLPSPQGRDLSFVDHLELFTAAMLRRRVPDEQVRQLAGQARNDARAAVASARAPLGSQEVLAYRSAYDRARGCGPAPALEATLQSALPARTRAARAFEALLTLRHRQRAALVLHDMAGMAGSEVAQILNVGRAEATRIVEKAREAVTAKQPRPINVRHALADAASRMIAAAPTEEAPAPPVRLPRPVVRTLLAPVPPASAQPKPPAEPPAPTPRVPTPALGDVTGATRADQALLALESAPADITVAPASPEPPAARTVTRPRPVIRPPIHQPRRRAALRSLLAAAALLVATAVILPANAGRSAPPEAPRVSATAPGLRPTTAVADRVTVAAVVSQDITVRRGDTLWVLAERHLGDGRRWPEIWELNARTRMPGGRFTDPDLIHPGWRLRLPHTG